MATFESNLPTVIRSMRSSLAAKGRRVSLLWRDGINDVMAETQMAGRRYYYTGLGWTRASLPGRPPAIQTGVYARSISVRSLGEYEWDVGSASEIGPYLQFGTENMAARPHMVEGYERRAPDIRREMNRRIF